MIQFLCVMANRPDTAANPKAHVPLVVGDIYLPVDRKASTELANHPTVIASGRHVVPGMFYKLAETGNVWFHEKHFSAMQPDIEVRQSETEGAMN